MENVYEFRDNDPSDNENVLEIRVKSEADDNRIWILPEDIHEAFKLVPGESHKFYLHKSAANRDFYLDLAPSFLIKTVRMELEYCGDTSVDYLFSIRHKPPGAKGPQTLAVILDDDEATLPKCKKLSKDLDVKFGSYSLAVSNSGSATARVKVRLIINGVKELEENGFYQGIALPKPANEIIELQLNQGGLIHLQSKVCMGPLQVYLSRDIDRYNSTLAPIMAMEAVKPIRGNKTLETPQVELNYTSSFASDRPYYLHVVNPSEHPVNYTLTSYLDTYSSAGQLRDAFEAGKILKIGLDTATGEIQVLVERPIVNEEKVRRLFKHSNIVQYSITLRIYFLPYGNSEVEANIKNYLNELKFCTLDRREHGIYQATEQFTHSLFNYYNSDKEHMINLQAPVADLARLVSETLPFTSRKGVIQGTVNFAIFESLDWEPVANIQLDLTERKLSLEKLLFTKNGGFEENLTFWDTALGQALLSFIIVATLIAVIVVVVLIGKRMGSGYARVPRTNTANYSTTSTDEHSQNDDRKAIELSDTN